MEQRRRYQSCIIAGGTFEAVFESFPDEPRIQYGRTFGGFDHGAAGKQPAAGEALDRSYALAAGFDRMAVRM